MTRTERTNPTPQKAPKNASTAPARRSQISRSLSKLLRHQAENEKIPISPAGWVKLDDLLAWRGLERIGKGITLSEIFEVVEEDGRVGKGRFEVKHLGRVDGSEGEPDYDELDQLEGSVGMDGAATGALVDDVAHLSVDEGTTSSQTQLQSATQTPTSTAQATNPLDPTSKNTPSTQAALHHHKLNPSAPPTNYLIRATQGHSIKTIESSSLLTPLTLSTPSLPNTVVHGTFYGAWPAILSTGGLKPMGRNNVHFATGPPLDEAMGLVSVSGGGKAQVDDVLSRNKVVSGMRWDAQLLIYVDLKHCLEDIAARGLDMQWWISGNGVVLTEGVTVPPSAPPSSSQFQNEAAVDNNSIEDSTPIIASKSAKMQKHKEIIGSQKIVPMEYWSVVVEIKNGLGVIWRQGEGVVKELPEHLRNMGLPRGKGRGERGGRGGRGSGSGKGGNGRSGGDRQIGHGDVDMNEDGVGGQTEE